MVRHNNQISNGHFHKYWQSRIKTWFDQPMKKVRRKRLREIKQMKMAPKPVEPLRPIVNCPTIRYNRRTRAGRGFSLEELKGAGLNKNYAQTIGIAVDVRRKTKSVEKLRCNVHRLKEYLSRLIIFPQSKKKMKEVMETSVAKTITKGLNKLPKPEQKLKARVPTEEEKALKVYITLRKARSEAKLRGRKLARLEMKAKGIEVPIKKKRRPTEVESK